MSHGVLVDELAATVVDPDRSLTTQKLVVVGQGYVGLPIAIRAAAAGFRVVGFDLDEERVDGIRAGRTFVDDVPEEELRAALEDRRYSPSTDAGDCADFDVAVITVPTPLKDNAPDLSYVREAARTLARFVRPGSTVILESTTYPGTTEELVAPILQKGSGLAPGTDFHLGYSPERIDPGNKDHPFRAVPKVVSGIDADSLREVDAFYSQLVTSTVPVSSPKVAELTKLLENTFRHVNIALINELAMFAWDLDIDVWEAIDAAATKPFGFMAFTPGPGVGGHCLPIDPSYLSWEVMRSLGKPFRFVELANEINSHMAEYVVRRVVHSLNQQQKSTNGSRILILGLAYKANTGDDRESPARAVVGQLLGDGADVYVVDTHVTRDHFDPRLHMVPLSRGEVRSADLVVILTDHDDVDYAMVVDQASAILDTRHRVNGARVEHL
jgi:UDP-N-acetyl-D-glucosamine dehydrogenase